MMARQKAWCTAAAVATTLLLADSVAASPSVWTKASNPSAKREDDAARKADEALSEDLSLRRLTNAFRRTVLLNRALSAMKQAGAATSNDPALRYRLAQIYHGLFDVNPEDELLQKAITHMELVARSTAPVTMRARALNSLAIGYARLGKHREEIDAYDRAIVIQPDPQSHSILLANQAEGYMALGRVVPAVRGYKASLSATPGALMVDSGVTTLWGLAVGLDRSGDLEGALERIRVARSYDPSDARINGPNWFYVPEHDEDWYAALGHWQWARDAKGEGDLKLESYRDAMATWRSYIERAPMSDPWLPLASRRLQQCERERDEQLARDKTP